MKLSTRARYGLKALIDLGLHCETEAVSIQSIASRQNISDSYLEQLMAKLKKLVWWIVPEVPVVVTGWDDRQQRFPWVMS
mgnify:CR=1 FL=1